MAQPNTIAGLRHRTEFRDECVGLGCLTKPVIIEFNDFA
jgi:hypothetical protein